MRFLLKELRWVGPGATVAAFAYALSPYLLHYGARISVILLPFAGLPWLIALMARGLRRGDWRSAAWFALVTLTVGGVNATSLLLVMVGPVLWALYATYVTREVTPQRLTGTALRMGSLTLLTSLWWVAGLSVQGRYGIPILRYTETYRTVANASVATEVLRGLGYWFFYGRDALGAWIAPAVTMTQAVPALALSFALPGLAAVAALLTRWSHRGYFAALVGIGVVVSVGSHPWDHPSLYGAVFKAWTTTESGLAFRSTPRAVPLVALGLAVFLGAGVAAVSRRWPGWHLPVSLLVLAAVCANASWLFRGQMVDQNLDRPEEIPTYWTQVGEFLDRGDRSTRAYEMPGTDFASYRWGNTVDPVTPGLTDREYVARELIPYGTPPSADLLNAYDMPLQMGTVDPDTLAPLARLLGVGQVVHRADLAYERFRTPRPRPTYRLLQSADGIGRPRSFGPRRENRPNPALPQVDSVDLAEPVDDTEPPAVSVFPVENRRPVARSVSATAPVLLSGDGAGVVALAASGGLQADRPVLYAGTLMRDPALLRQSVRQPGASLVVTDTNRRQARRWGTVRDNDGYTERAGEQPLVVDAADNRLEVFPGTDDTTRTVVEQDGPVDAAASRYGNPVSYTPADRAANAVDGDPATAWRTAAFARAEGEFLELTFDRPVRAGELTILQSQRRGNRWITGVDLSFDGRAPVPVGLGDESLTPPGQTVQVPRQSFSRLRLTITQTNLGPLSRFDGISDVGIAELRIPGVTSPLTEYVRLPDDLLRGAGDAASRLPLEYLLTRRWSDPADGLAGSEELVLRRRFEVPAAREFTTFGKVRLAAGLPDEQVDAALGLPDAEEGGITATSSGRLIGVPSARAGAAVDGDDATSWSTPVAGAQDQWLQVTYPSPQTAGDLQLLVVTDGRHSVPTRMELQVDDGEVLELDVPDLPVGTGEPRGATSVVTVPLDGVSGTTFRFTVTGVREVRSAPDGPALPVAIAELGLPVRPELPADTPVPDECRTDLFTVGGPDGATVPVRVVGTVGDALARRPLRLESCGTALDLAQGTTTLVAAPGTSTGWDVDLLALSSGEGGGPGPDTLAERPEDGPAPPATTVRRTGRLSYRYSVATAQEPYWLVLGQSFSEGWTARTADGTSLGPPTLVNGFANGWYVDPAKDGASLTVDVVWTPQRTVWVALVLSALGVLVCLALALLSPLRGSGRPVRKSRLLVVAPEVLGPFAPDGGPVPTRAAVLGTLAVGAVSVVAIPWWAALPVAAVTFVALRARHGQVLLRAVVLGVLTLAFGFVVAKQLRNGYRVDFEWMNAFEVTHAPTMAAVALLVADPFVSLLRRRHGGEGQRRGRSQTANSTRVDGSTDSATKNSSAVIPD
ncbi:MAG: alpha-(1-_3)-arabinofuranosyltransferase family protein [Actinomycetes bacterium]